MTETETIQVLTDRPDLYEPFMKHMGKTGVYHATVESLSTALVNCQECSGVILDIRLVMAAEEIPRNRLFSLVKGRPVVRSRIDPDTDAPQLIDPGDNLHQYDDSRLRTENRVKVRLEAAWAEEDDPVMAGTNEGVLLNLSAGGAFLHATNVLPDRDYIYLKILEFENKRPIHCAVRWRANRTAPGLFTGVGLKFIDISDRQTIEIQETLLESQSR